MKKISATSLRIKSILLMLIFLANIPILATKIAVLGCGYVGSTLTAVLADLGHKVICYDVDKNKINSLKQNILPFYEPNLDTLLFKGAASGNVSFASAIDEIMDAQIFFICVGTPTNEQGQCDCSYLYSAVDAVSNHHKKRSVAIEQEESVFANLFKTLVNHEKAAHFRSQGRKIICVKSTLPPQTMHKLQEYLIQHNNTNFDLVYNPEFMREGTALRDMCSSNPIIIGGVCAQAVDAIEDVYRDFLKPGMKVIKTNFETAEMIKYAWNSFSAIRIGYVNELALLCRKVGADIATTVQGFALSEQLLPTDVLRPGPGYGGSCLPKDTTSFASLLGHHGFPETLVHQAIKSNKNQKEQVVKDILSVIDKDKNPTVALLGLAFKANTDDIRYASAITVIEALVELGIRVQAYDPKAANNMQKLFPQVHYYDSPYEAARNADCIVALTEWHDIKTISLEKLAQLCRTKVLIDTRNLYDPRQLEKYGFTYINMGRLNIE